MNNGNSQQAKQMENNPALQEITEEDPILKCKFCRTSEVNEPELGMLYKLDDDLVAHYLCLVFSSDLLQKGEEHEGINGFMRDDIEKELWRGRFLKCRYCRKNGATIGCDLERKFCRASFHLPCALANRVRFQARGETPARYCEKHKRTTDEGIPEVEEEDNTDDSPCVICQSELERKDMIFAPCCRKSNFHLLCLKRLACSAGLEFNCPLCQDKITFVDAMRDAGIFVPHREPKWESEPGAFAELNVPAYSGCRAKRCFSLNKRRRMYDKPGCRSYSLVPCNDCGSSATHLICSGLKEPADWSCGDCTDDRKELLSVQHQSSLILVPISSPERIKNLQRLPARAHYGLPVPTSRSTSSPED